jgi:hypothetical protein
MFQLNSQLTLRRTAPREGGGCRRIASPPGGRHCQIAGTDREIQSTAAPSSKSSAQRRVETPADAEAGESSQHPSTGVSLGESPVGAVKTIGVVLSAAEAPIGGRFRD